MGRTSLPLFQINQYQNQNQNKAVSGLKEGVKFSVSMGKNLL